MRFDISAGSSVLEWLLLILIWFIAGFGWHTGAWVVNRILNRRP